MHDQVGVKKTHLLGMVSPAQKSVGLGIPQTLECPPSASSVSLLGFLVLGLEQKQCIQG